MSLGKRAGSIAALLSLACGADGGEPQPPAGWGSSGAAGTSGYCAASLPCFEACLCATGDVAGCQLACAGSGGTGGVAGSGGGAGSTGGSAAAAGTAGSGAGGAGGAGTAGSAGFYPVPDWPTDTPQSVGLDPARLEAAAEHSRSFGGLCTVVVRKGKLVFERYYNGAQPGDLHKSWSVAKSFTSALVGIMLRRGEIQSVDQKASEWIDSWKGTDKENLTLRILLQMTQGAQFEFISDNTFTVTSADFTRTSLERPIVKTPGTVYEYSNMTVQAFEPIIRAATGMDAEAYAQQHLWGPLGFGPATYWFRDPAGNPAVFMGVNATCRDMARFGYLYLWRGHWNGEQVVPADWVDASTHPDPASPNQAHNNYWWLNGYTPAINSGQEPQPGRLFPDAPPDMFMALGFGQNFIDVVPSTETIYVHMRPAPHEDMLSVILDPLNKIDEMLNDVKDLPHQQLWRDYFGPAG